MANVNKNKGTAIPRTFGYSEFNPRIWHGMTLLPWLGLVGKNLKRIAPRRYPLAVSITFAATLNSIFAAFTKVIYARRIEKTEINQRPVFILGYWRSGTTWLNELLVCDEQNFSPTNFQCFTPKTFLLTQKFSGLLGLLIPKSRPMDRVEFSMAHPQEDEFAMLNCGAKTPYRYMAFPSIGASMADQHLYWPQDGKEQKHWTMIWMQFLRTLQFANPGKRPVLKSPPHTARVSIILEQFPDAKFIHISRDPYGLFASNLKMTKAMSATQGLEIDLPPDAKISAEIIEMHNRIYNAFFNDQAAHPELDICFVNYEDLCADPQAQIRRIYKHLDLGSLDKALPSIERLIANKKDFKADKYDLSPELTRQLQREWATYIDRFGYASKHRQAVLK